MRTLVAAVSVVLLAAAGLTVAATATTTKHGLPAYTDGYTDVAQAEPAADHDAGRAQRRARTSTPASARAANRRFPNGTVIVKSIAEPGAKGLADQVAVMRKVQGRWQWVEYTLDDGRYGVLAQGSLCTQCHMQARANDWVFTR